MSVYLELERIYGVRQGSAGKSDRPLVAGKTPQEQVAEQLGISTKDIQRYKKLTTLIPELQDMVDTDQISTSVASRILSKTRYHVFTINSFIKTIKSEHFYLPIHLHP